MLSGFFGNAYLDIFNWPLSNQISGTENKQLLTVFFTLLDMALQYTG